MADIIVRRLADETKARLKARAKRHGRSLEAEARAILELAADAAEPDGAAAKPVGLGTLMRQRFRKSGLTNEEAKEFDRAIAELRRNSKPRDPGF